MAENTSKRVFHADIFAEDNDKWSWSAPSVNAKSTPSIPNYAALRKATKEESSSNSESEEESALRSDSNSVKRSFRKRSSSNSEGNPLEDVSSSPCNSSALPHERVLPPSMYDDDARSASPSTYTKKDLGFASSFRKEFGTLPPTVAGSFSTFDSKIDKAKASEKESRKIGKDFSPNGSPRNSKSESRKSRSKRSSSQERKSVRRSKSRSRSKGRHTKSPPRDRRRSRSRDRHLDKDRRHNSRSRSKRSRSRDSKRSRSKDSRRKSRSRSRDSKRRSRSPSRDSRRRSLSRNRESRRRSRSRSHDRRRSRSRSHDRRQRNQYRSSSRDMYRRKRYSRSRSRSRDRSGSGNRKPGSLPLSTSGGAMTPQMALQQSLAALNAKTQAKTGIVLPKYYNPAAVNPLKYAEQVQKRKLLWGSSGSEKVEEQPKSSVWDKLTFAQDQDGKMTAKFRKLMGIKTDNPAKEPEDKESVLEKQEELFRNLDQQYEMARVTTHTQRGVGLGYSAQPFFPPVQK